MSFPWKNILRNVQNERNKTNFIVILNYSIVIYLWFGTKVLRVCNIIYGTRRKILWKISRKEIKRRVKLEIYFKWNFLYIKSKMLRVCKMNYHTAIKFRVFRF